MGTIINASIDLTKVDKSKLVKGKYLNLSVTINEKTDSYGNNVSLTLSQSKEERESKAPKTYLGNGKVVWTDGVVKAAEKQEKEPLTATQKMLGKDDLPF